ncbi:MULTISPECIES: hypothetical protein [Cronobacter]|uniref:hypothetical protein n=1 Tax=Cronobacter TaxID=413496 RepID=UPI000BE9F83D|nr:MULTISPECIES: hypothetical protein [Cronobacter]ELY6202320.1 hypothetical protein [Cronobacter malonaticus]ELY6256195.1 hypothetical protein [Cronobacter malonaticus]NCG99797.1 hypothetical protein [Cronobacter malonaticus]NCH50143.1 hypothetical protein [Cronobacter malonaticus]NCH53530.1 hypothetical protein [Cronobacter muytjensii]
MDSDDMKFRIVYDGPALDTHEMDVRDLAPALLSLSDALEEAGRTIYGKEKRISVKVNASFKAGSFGVDLIAHSASLTSQIIGAFSGNNASAACNIISLVGFGYVASKQSYKGLIQLIKWLGPKKINRIEPTFDGRAEIFIDNESEIFDNQVIDLYKNKKIRRSLENVITRPLEREGIDSFAVTIDNGQTFVEVSKEEAYFFKVGRFEDTIISESITERALQPLDISFREGHKWQFSDGAIPFQAEVSDEKFLKAIDEQSVAFAKGDLLLVDLKVTQYLAEKGIKTAYEIVNVKKIINPQRQINLPF